MKSSSASPWWITTARSCSRRTPRARTRTRPLSSSRRTASGDCSSATAACTASIRKATSYGIRPLGEAQHVVAGRFRSDSPLQVMAVDRTPVPAHRRDANAWAILYLYDLDGRELWHRQMEKGEWCIAARRPSVAWAGPAGLRARLWLFSRTAGTAQARAHLQRPRRSHG